MTSIFHEPDTSSNKIKVVCSSNERRGYEKRSAFFVHSLFNGEKEWPLTTNVACRYDGEPFESIPIPLPIDYNTETNTYSCYGIFCSAACVKAFMENNPVYSNALSMIWLKKIMCEVFDDFDDIIEAPPVDLLIKHGGELTIEQFRAFGRQKTRIITHRMPFFTCALAFELVKEYGGESKPRTVEKESKTFKKLHRHKKQPITKQQPEKEQLTPLPEKQPQHDHDPPVPEIPVLSLIQPPAGVKSRKMPSDVDVLPSIAEAEGHMMDDGHDDKKGGGDDGDKNDDAEELFKHERLLPDSITLVPATVGNRWEIRGLQRPSVPLDIQTPTTQQNTKSLFQEYVEKRTQSKTSTDQTTVVVDSKPQKRRGRPKSTKSKPDSPKQNPQGTLVSFLKVK